MVKECGFSHNNKSVKMYYGKLRKDKYTVNEKEKHSLRGNEWADGLDVR